MKYSQYLVINFPPRTEPVSGSLSLSLSLSKCCRNPGTGEAVLERLGGACGATSMVLTRGKDILQKEIRFMQYKKGRSAQL